VSSTAKCPQAQVRTVFFTLICVASATPFIHLVTYMPVQVQTRLQLSRHPRAPM
jgi:SNF family Na+-dependent transporter